MANEEHLKILKQGVSEWNRWRRQQSEIPPNLIEAHLSREDFRGADFSAANLHRVDLSGADLTRADLYLAVLTGADLHGAVLRQTNLHAATLVDVNFSEAELNWARLLGAKLNRANLNRASLIGADLTMADLNEIDISEATVWGTTFANVDLTTVKGIETIKHKGPSTIGVDTIYRSQGKIPEIFLHGAGVPDHFIEYMSSLVGKVFEFYSCFISYSGKDQEFASRIYADLQGNGVRCWFAPHDVQAGKKLYEQIDTAIRLHERLLLILSSDSINSEWVKTEIAKARKREIKEGKRMLFPIRLNISFDQLEDWECFDADRGKDSAREIREYYIPDFTGWKDHDHYQEEFRKLLRDLKKETVIAAMA